MLSPAAALGAYGIALEGLDSAARPWLRPAEDGWSTWRLVTRKGRGRTPPLLSRDLALLQAGGGGIIELDRREQTVTITSPDPSDVTSLVHPYLTAVGAVVAHWQQELAFHAGAVVVDGATWGVLGARGAGKSTLLALLAAAGHHVLTDDLAVLRGEQVQPGPRCIDLREPSAKALGLGQAVRRAGVVRWRVPVAGAASSRGLAGWVLPEWSDKTEIQTEPSHLLVPTLEHYLAVRTQDPLRPADLSSPGTLVRFARPRLFKEAPASVAALLRHLRALT